MPSEKVLLEKQQMVAELKEKLEKAVSGVMVDYKGIDVANDTKLRRELREAGVDYSVYKNSVIRFAVEGTAFADLAKQSASLPKNKYDVKESYVLNAINFIQINLSNRELDADYVAQYLNLNTDYFLRIFKNVMGTAFSKYIVAKRMSLAISLMDDGKMSIREIALQCGYEDASYFTKSFRLAYNQSPTEYIKKHIDHIRKNTKASDKD